MEEIPRTCPSPVAERECLPRPATIDDDAIEEILIRLPRKSLERCKCLSKKWHVTISSDSHFRRRFFRAQAAAGCPSQFLGLFLSYRWHKDPEPLCFCPAPPRGLQLKDTPPLLDLDDSLGFIGSFISLEVPPFNLVASSNGFLLCNSHPFYAVDYTLCNPIFKQFIRLPPSPSRSAFVSHGLFCDPSTCCSSSDAVNYKVVRGVWPTEDLWAYFNTLQIEIFSSEEGGWKTLRLTCPFHFQFFDLTNRPAMVSDHRGGGEVVFYWEAVAAPDRMRCVVVFDPRKDYLHLIKMPESRDYLYHIGQGYQEVFGKSEGSITYIRTNMKHLETWTLDESAGEWRIKHKVDIGKDLPQLEKMIGAHYGMYMRAVHPQNSQLIFIYTMMKLVMYDAGSSKFELVCSLGDAGDRPRQYYFFVYEWPDWAPPFLI